MLGRIVNIGAEGFLGEPEQDANSALTELDKGLRSVKVGDQCEAIVRFPRLFEKYPFPILINSAFLKLADVFRVGNNFLRLWVLKVTQQSEKHLDKILNIDEYVRRLYTVIYSNDPLARALTLRTLGSIASIISERKNVHHSIRDSFDSHDAVELEAAIYAAAKFSAHSKNFAATICKKIEEMIQKLATPVDMKLKLIPVLQHMHHDAQTSAIVRKLCSDLLQNYPAVDFVTVTLHTLTSLSAVTMVDIPQQVELLVQYLEKDPRVAVGEFVLKELEILALKGAHMWSPVDINCVIRFAHHTTNNELRCDCLQVLSALSESTEAADKLLTLSSKDDQFSVLDLCQECCYQDNLELASLAVQLYTLLALHSYKVSANDFLVYDTATAIECLLLTVTSKNDANEKQILAVKHCLLCAVKLCKSNVALCHRFIDTIGGLVTSVKGPVRLALCETLCAIGSIKSGVLSPILHEIVAELKIFIDDPESMPADVVGKLCTLVFQAMKDKTWKEEMQNLIHKVADRSKLWQSYKIGRQAARYGHHGIATRIFTLLTTKVSSEHLYFWLISLVEFCQAETFLQAMSDSSSSLDMINFAIMHYMKGMSALKASTTPAHQMHVQCEYVRLRSEMLKVFVFTIEACNTLRSCPPPAIAATMATTSRDDLLKSGRVIIQLRKALNDFQKLAVRFKDFSQGLFNSDPVTLKVLQIQHFNCLLGAHTISSVVLRDVNFPFLDIDAVREQLQSSCLEVDSMAQASYRATDIVREFLNESSELEGITYKQIDVLNRVVKELLKAPICFPRYYFQTLQSTSIKLAISPQHRGQDPIMIQNSSHLAVKVEGVVQHNSNPGIFRDVAEIQLSVSSSLQSRNPSNQDIKINTEVTNQMKQIVKPHNDYFSAQFLLAFPVSGLHLVIISTSLIDEAKDVWNTGPKSSLSVKSFEDPTMIGKQGQTAPSSRISFPPRH